jgi:hypothetical protein
MAGSKLQLNWSAVGFTPPDPGTLIPITHVQEVQVDPGGTLLTYAGDNDRYPTTIVNAMSNPKVSVTSADTGGLQGISPGTVGTFTATHLDAKGATGGNIVYTVINAVVENTPGGGQFGAWSSGTMTMLAFSSDGSTSPISFTRS